MKLRAAVILETKFSLSSIILDILFLCSRAFSRSTFMLLIYYKMCTDNTLSNNSHKRLINFPHNHYECLSSHAPLQLLAYKKWRGKYLRVAKFLSEQEAVMSEIIKNTYIYANNTVSSMHKICQNSSSTSKGKQRSIFSSVPTVETDCKALPSPPPGAPTAPYL